MKNIFLILFFTATVQLVIGQKRGLEKIIVEKYYISDANDAKTDMIGGALPIGSVTYRIYVDMLPGYRFQAAYGVDGHELRITTSTKFFNNHNFGGIVPTVIPDQVLGENTVMLDSWLSVGAASEFAYGILKSKDKASKEKTIVNKDGILLNSDQRAGIPVKTADGLVILDGIVPKVTGFGIDSLIEDYFGKGLNRKYDPAFSTNNGSWACLGGSIGPDSLDNQVLIAQITTDGDFSFELNIQIGTPSGGVENYVARNPVGEEIQFDSLIYNSSAMKKKGYNRQK